MFVTAATPWRTEAPGAATARPPIRALASQQDYVLSYEPPDGERVIVATNGVAYVQLEVKGLASHAGSAPEHGRNAAVELAGQIMQLNDLGDASSAEAAGILKQGAKAMRLKVWPPAGSKSVSVMRTLRIRFGLGRGGCR